MGKTLNIKQNNKAYNGNFRKTYQDFAGSAR